MKTKTFVIDGVKVELTKDEVQERYSNTFKNNYDKMQVLAALANSAERRGEKDLARKYRRQHVDLKSEIDFYAFNPINWN